MEGRGRGCEPIRQAILPSGSEEAGVAPPSVDRCPARPSPAPSAERGQSSPRGWAMPLGLLFQLQVKPVWGARRGSGGDEQGWRIQHRRVKEAACGGEAPPRLPPPEHRSGQKEAPEEPRRKSGERSRWVWKSLVAGREGSGPSTPLFFQAPPLHRSSLPAPVALLLPPPAISAAIFPGNLLLCPDGLGEERPFHVPGRNPLPSAQNFAALTSEDAWWAEYPSAFF